MGSNPSRPTQTEWTGNQCPHQSRRISQQSVSLGRSQYPSDRTRRVEPGQSRCPDDDLVWPLPPNEYDLPFEIQDIDPNRYSLTPLSPRVSYTADFDNVLVTK